MALLSQIIRPGDLARLSDAQLDVLTAALDAELLQNAAVKKAVTSKIQAMHKDLTSRPAGAAKKK